MTKAEVARLAGRRERPPEPPEHLSVPRRELWGQLVAEYRFDTAGLELLRLLCETLDRVEEARLLVEKDGAVVEGRFGKKAHPATIVERDARTAATRLFRELGLEQERPPASPPQLRARRGDHR